MLGGAGLPGLLSVRPHFCWGGGGVGAAKGLLPCFLVPKGNQPTACILALWWLKFGPTECAKGGGGGASVPRDMGRQLMPLAIGTRPLLSGQPLPPLLGVVGWVGGSEAEENVCAPQLGLQFLAPLINFIFAGGNLF